jgi:glycosyltransferase involved in cell wall biosynthesis
MNKIVMIGAVPPPYTGHSISFSKLYQSLLKDIEEVEYINTAPQNKHITGKATWSRIFENLSVLKQLWLSLRSSNPETIYVTKGSTKVGFIRDFLTLLISKILSKKSKFIIHLKGGNYDSFYESQNSFFKLLIRYFLKKSDRIIVLGDSLVKMYDFYPKIKDKIIVVENALTAPIEKNSYIYFDSSKEKVELLFLSNLIYTKGYMDLLKAVEILIDKKVFNFHLTFAGAFIASPDDPFGYDITVAEDEFLKRIKSDKLKEYISYLGVVIGEEKEVLLRESDIFILPTAYHVEGQPVSIIEAMAYGCAIVSTKYRSIPDIVSENKNGFYVEYGNPLSISSKIEELLNDKEKLEKASSVSVDLYNKRFQWKIHYAKMRKILVGM